MDNREIITELGAGYSDTGAFWAAIDEAKVILESLDELNRLCARAETRLQKYASKNWYNADRATEQLLVVQGVISFLNGDPTDLKNLAGEK
jgi:hypothetical protein